MRVDEFDSDPERGYQVRAPLVGRASNLQVGSAEALLARGRYRLQLHDLAFTAADTSLRIGEMSYRPLVGDDSASRNERLSSGPVFNIDNRDLLIEGIDRIALMSEGAVRARRFELRDPTVDLYVQMPAGEQRPAAPAPAGAVTSDDLGLAIGVELIEIDSADYQRFGTLPDHDWGTPPALLDAFRDVDITVRGVRFGDPGDDRPLKLHSLTLDAQELRATPGRGPDRVRLNNVSLDTAAGTLRAGLLRFGPPTLGARFAGKASGFDITTGALSLSDMPMLDLLDALQPGGESGAWMDVLFRSGARLDVDTIAMELPDRTPLSARSLQLAAAGALELSEVDIAGKVGVHLPRVTVSGADLRGQDPPIPSQC